MGRARKKNLSKLSPQAFQHPLDRTAILSLEKVPGMDWIIRRFLAVIGDRRLRLFYLASGVRVHGRQYRRVNRIYEKACQILDMPKRPELFIVSERSVNAVTLGVAEPFIAVNAPMLEIMNEAELQCVLGHELGHVACGHSLYNTMLTLLLRAWQIFMTIPGGIYAAIAVTLALLEWSRSAELSADRAGLLVAQDPTVSYAVNMKLAGGRSSGEMNLEEFQRQADEYRAGGDLLDGVLKLMLIAPQTHPFPVLRVAELRRWVDSGEYARILKGSYPKRGKSVQSPWIDSVKATANSYQQAMAGTQDPFLQTIQDLAGGASAVGSDLLEFIRRSL